MNCLISLICSDMLLWSSKSNVIYYSFLGTIVVGDYSWGKNIHHPFSSYWLDLLIIIRKSSNYQILPISIFLFILHRSMINMLFLHQIRNLRLSWSFSQPFIHNLWRLAICPFLYNIWEDWLLIIIFTF